MKERIVFPKGSFQDLEFEKFFEQYYNMSTLTEHEAYRKACKHFWNQRKH